MNNELEQRATTAALYNFHNRFQLTKLNYEMVKRYTMDTKRSMNKFHDNIVGNLQYMDNKTTQTVKLTGESNDLLKQMRNELKEDFNNYANKVRTIYLQI